MAWLYCAGISLWQYLLNNPPYQYSLAWVIHYQKNLSSPTSFSTINKHNLTQIRASVGSPAAKYNATQREV